MRLLEVTKSLQLPLYKLVIIDNEIACTLASKNDLVKLLGMTSYRVVMTCYPVVTTC